MLCLLCVLVDTKCGCCAVHIKRVPVRMIMSWSGFAASLVSTRPSCGNDCINSDATGHSVRVAGGLALWPKEGEGLWRYYWYARLVVHTF